MTEQQTFRKFPELQKGIRVQFVDKDGKLRTERIHSRRGNTITVINALKVKSRVPIIKIQGYWKPKVKCTIANLTVLFHASKEYHQKALKAAYKKQKRKEELNETGLLKCNDCAAKECGL